MGVLHPRVRVLLLPGEAQKSTKQLYCLASLSKIPKIYSFNFGVELITFLYRFLLLGVKFIIMFLL